MKKSVLHTMIGLALPMVLAACGGGGGDDNQAADKPAPMPETPKPAVEDATAAGLSTGDVEAVRKFSDSVQRGKLDGPITGVVFETKVGSLENGDFASRSVEIARNNNFNILRSSKVNAQIINLTDLQTKPSRQFGDIDVYLDYDRSPLYSYQYFMVSRTYDRGYVHSQFGLARTEGTLPSIFAFYRGAVTPKGEMPESGQAVYRGEMILLPELRPSIVHPIGSVAANVDFGTKYMAFSVTADSYKEDMIGKIEGSAFMGKEGDKSFDGFFTGNGAQEMVGGYYDLPAGVVGVFGAKRQ